MSTLIERLALEALALAPAERVRLAEELLATVHQFDVAVEAAWDEEILLRIREIEAGTAKLVPATEAFAEIRQLLK